MEIVRLCTSLFDVVFHIVLATPWRTGDWDSFVCLEKARRISPSITARKWGVAAAAAAAAAATNAHLSAPPPRTRLAVTHRAPGRQAAAEAKARRPAPRRAVRDAMAVYSRICGGGHHRHRHCRLPSPRHPPALCSNGGGGGGGSGGGAGVPTRHRHDTCTAMASSDHLLLTALLVAAVTDAIGVADVPPAVGGAVVGALVATATAAAAADAAASAAAASRRPPTPPGGGHAPVV